MASEDPKCQDWFTIFAELSASQERAACFSEMPDWKLAPWKEAKFPRSRVPCGANPVPPNCVFSGKLGFTVLVLEFFIAAHMYDACWLSIEPGVHVFGCVQVDCMLPMYSFPVASTQTPASEGSTHDLEEPTQLDFGAISSTVHVPEAASKFVP